MDLWTPQQPGEPQRLKDLSRNDLVRYVKNLTQSLQNMSVRAHLAACELHAVDKGNKIFEMSEGVFDKEHLFHVRKALSDGSYEKNRDIARL